MKLKNKWNGVLSEREEEEGRRRNDVWRRGEEGGEGRMCGGEVASKGGGERGVKEGCHMLRLSRDSSGLQHNNTGRTNRWLVVSQRRSIV